GFYFGEDHWTCLAVDGAWDLLPPGARRDRYADFCEGFARFLDRSQLRRGEGPARGQPDLAGGYGFGPLLLPHTAAVGSRSESLVSAWRLAHRRGHVRPAGEIAAQLRRGLGFL